MYIQILSARADIEPFSVVHHQAANLTTLAYPIGDNRNERDFLLRRNSRENGRIPNSNIGEIKISPHAIAIRDIYDAVIAQSDVRTQTCFAQCERDVVPTTEMFVDQGLKVDVRQDVAAVSEEGAATKTTFRILDSTARLKQIRLVNQDHGMTFILFVAKRTFK